jgi:hypothetical protein
MIGKKSVGELAEKLADNLEKTREEQKGLCQILEGAGYPRPSRINSF